MRGARWAPWVLVAWTVFVWSTRLRNGDLTIGAVLPAALLLVLAAAVLVTRAHALAVTLLAALTVVVWVVRLPLIVLGDHSLAFEVVHAGLAAVSVGLAGWSVRTTSR